MGSVAILLDGGHIRVLAKRANFDYTPEFIEKISLSCILPGEELLRVLYYDCAPYKGTVRLPVSGASFEFSGSDAWLKKLAQKNLFAIRLGILKFRGYKPRNIPITAGQLSDNDFKPDFEQKGVDMRIGLDMANFAAAQSVKRVILASADTDCIPAMKHCRKAGLQVVLLRFPNSRLVGELCQHSDFVRDVPWPD